MIGMALDLRNERLECLRRKIDAGGGAGTLCIYSGPRPYTGGPSTTKLCELQLSHPCGPEVEDAVLMFDPITPCDSAEGSGKALWARILDSKGRFVIDLTVGTGEGNIRLASTDIREGMSVKVKRAYIGEGNA